LIEVNLIPGGKRRGSGRPKLSLKIPSIGLGDRWVLGSSAVILLGVVLAAYLYWNTNRTLTDLDVEITTLQADSARYEEEISALRLLEEREDSILQRAMIIQEIDEDRYVWPHILDEMARALPDYTWLTEIMQVSLGEELQFRVQGRAGNNFAVTQFMENLEASLFISNVQLISAERVPESAGGFDRAVTSFSLEAFFDRPPDDLLETVPLFEAPIEGGDPPGSGL
jgi:Tfp pilus assembly protein PilN